MARRVGSERAKKVESSDGITRMLYNKVVIVKTDRPHSYAPTFCDALPDHSHGYQYLHQVYSVAENTYAGGVL
jgi:hypothetical protein